jgi:hypothetical protein
MSIDENRTAHHEAGHAVLAYESIDVGAIESVSIVSGSDYLGAHVNSDAFQAKVQTLMDFVEGGVVGVMAKAEAEGEPTYDDWDDDQINAEAARLQHECDLRVDVCLAGHVAEEVFCGIPNDITTDSDWLLAKEWASKLGRCPLVADVMDCQPYFDSRWKTVSELLDGKYREAVEALAEQLLVKKTISGAKATRIISVSFLPELADRAENSNDWNATSFL